MKKILLAVTAGLLLALPAACICTGHRGGPGDPGCRRHQGCECKCRQQPDCPKTDCPQQQAPASPAPAK